MIFLTEGSNPSLLHCSQVLYHMSHQEAHVSVYICVYMCVCVYIHISMWHYPDQALYHLQQHRRPLRVPIWSRVYP